MASAAGRAQVLAAAACLALLLSLRVLKLMSALVARSGAERGVVTMPHRSACLITALGFAATRERRIAYKAATHLLGLIKRLRVFHEASRSVAEISSSSVDWVGRREKLKACIIVMRDFAMMCKSKRAYNVLECPA